MHTIILRNGNTSEIDDKWLEAYKQGMTVKDTDGCVIPFHGTEGTCTGETVAKVGTSKVGTAKVG